MIGKVWINAQVPDDTDLGIWIAQFKYELSRHDVDMTKFDAECVKHEGYIDVTITAPFRSAV